MRENLAISHPLSLLILRLARICNQQHVANELGGASYNLDVEIWCERLIYAASTRGARALRSLI